MTIQTREDDLENWEERECAAEVMVPLIGSLFRDKLIETSVYGNLVVKSTVNDILKAHDFAHQVEHIDLSPLETLDVVKALAELPIGGAHIDAGKFAVKFRENGKGQSLDDYLKKELVALIPFNKSQVTNRAIVLYGFGRIGRLLARLLTDQTGGGIGFRLRAIVVRKGEGNDLVKRASLLRFDSVHGPFNGIVDIDEETNTMIVNGQRIQVIYSDAPDSIDYTAYDINNAIVVDNTGKWRDREGLGLHLKAAGVEKAMLTAPGKGDIKNIVHGINSDSITDEDTILSAASCTTNAITPILKAINDKFGIINGHLETVHSYTNDQNLIDNYHKGDRRGRSAPLNMVLTETGAATAVAKALPEMAGKLTGSSVRVPTPNVSIVILSLNLETEVTKEAINDYMRYIAMHSDLQKQVGYTNSPEAVSSDFVGSRSAGVFDAVATIATGNRCVLYVWYDNEYGYSCQLIRILREISNAALPVYPVEG